MSCKAWIQAIAGAFQEAFTDGLWRFFCLFMFDLLGAVSMHPCLVHVFVQL